MKNYILKAFLVIIFLMILSGCGNTQPATDVQTLSFPGTTWDMTPEEIIEAFNLKEDDYETVLPDEGNPYYQLNKILKNILLQVRTEEPSLLKTLGPLKKIPMGGENLYCEFHETRGHDNLIRTGAWKKYIAAKPLADQNGSADVTRNSERNTEEGQFRPGNNR